MVASRHARGTTCSLLLASSSRVGIVLKNYSRPAILLSLLEKLYATLRRGELLHGHALLRVVKNTGQVGTLLELVIAIAYK